MKNFRRGTAIIAVSALAGLALAACGQSKDEGNKDAGSGLVVGTTDKVTSIDPAGSYDNGSFAVQNQVFPFLMNTPYGSPDVDPDIAVSAEFTAPTEYTVKLKPDLKWANGHDLTSADVKFSFDRSRHRRRERPVLAAVQPGVASRRSTTPRWSSP